MSRWDAVEALLGVALIVTGCALWWPPAAFVVGGCALVLFAVLPSGRPPGRGP